MYMYIYLNNMDIDDYLISDQAINTLRFIILYLSLDIIITSFCNSEIK
jgi:hypothetical protein